ncbi:DoxX family protein [Flavobacterium sp. SUN046]|uniref:DoxX family protein n=1 Tax=Flavobacterium sp. SUN046 TaxID=3002440 RepID=UPI002DB62437|nr:DoxX family protein [Flavobacterium sp. SUN046]MEC4050944.1 DoxX family protein [Flavobacterium sp. SUN046]
MENFSWIIQLLLAGFFTIPGLTKIKTSKDALIAMKKISQNGSIVFIRILGVSELLGVFTMILTIWLKEFYYLTALASIGFSIVMIGALVVHFKKNEFKKIPVLLIALLLSLMLIFINIK